MSSPTSRPHSYRVVARTGDTHDVLVHATADLDARTVMLTPSGQPAFELDAVTARALHLVLGHAVYDSLGPTGPRLYVERDTGQGWRHVRELR